jgi:hypothetical protein
MDGNRHAWAYQLHPRPRGCTAMPHVHVTGITHSHHNWGPLATGQPPMPKRGDIKSNHSFSFACPWPAEVTEPKAVKHTIDTRKPVSDYADGTQRRRLKLHRRHMRERLTLAQSLQKA